jgi:hypothetical protein
MERPLRTGRAYEHWLPHRRGDSATWGAWASGPRETHYDVLMRVSFRHSYYNRAGDDDACTDLSASPTPATLELMHTLGLLFRDEGTGFSVLYDTARRTDLILYLRRRGEKLDQGEEQFWTRLSFTLASRSPDFISVTDIPINLNSTERNFYFSNLSAHRDPEDGKIILNSNTQVSEDELLPVIPPQFPVSLPNDVLGVEVRAISGEVVLCEPRCPPCPPASKPPVARCGEWLESLPPPAPNRCRDTVNLNFSSLPEDKYAIAYVRKGGARSLIGEYLYTVAATATPLAFIDLLFSAPTAQAEGLYPVQNLARKAEANILPVEYLLSFEARATVWNYYVVLPPPALKQTLGQLSIHSTSGVTFAGPCGVILPNGAKAYRFVSEQPLRLRQQSRFVFRLCGRYGDSPKDDVVIDRLPVAGKQVLPRTSAMARLNFARSVCPEAEDGEECRQLIRHFFGGSRVSHAGAVKRMRALRAKAQKGAPSRLPADPGAEHRIQAYSDIYVYV